MMQTASERIRALIEQAAMSAGGLSAFGRLVGVNASSVLEWQRGTTLPTLDKIPLLAVLLHQDKAALRECLVEAMEERLERRRDRPAPLRPTLGTVDSGSAAPRSNRRPGRGRRFQVAIASVASAGTLAITPSVVVASPIKNQAQLTTEARDSVASEEAA